MNSRNRTWPPIIHQLRLYMFVVSLVWTKSFPIFCQGKAIAFRQLSGAKQQMPFSLSSKRKVIVIAGPTAVGKSDVAARICDKNRGLIVSADSVQAYRGVQIGANKPSAEEQLRTPHILVDIVDHMESYNAADWSRDAVLAIESICGTNTQGEVGGDSRRKLISGKVADARSIKGYAEGDTLLPVICGGECCSLSRLQGIDGSDTCTQPIQGP